MQDKGKRQTYFENMSESMATFCDIFATVMDKDINNVRMDGIWGTVEFETLQKYGNDGVVFQIDAISPDGSDTRVYWTRDIVGKVKRQDTGSLAPCGADDDTAAIFDEGGELEVIW
jgi:hypothetical protein